MSVAITGNNRTKDGRVSAYIECDDNSQRLEIFRGSVHTHAAEAIVAVPDGWCAGNARLLFASSESDINVGVGAVFEITWLSYLKSTFLGLLPYFALALALLGAAMLAGAALAVRLRFKSGAFPSALSSLGAIALLFFYTYALPSGRYLPQSVSPQCWR
jgi:hypothetical protein